MSSKIIEISLHLSARFAHFFFPIVQIPGRIKFPKWNKNNSMINPILSQRLKELKENLRLSWTKVSWSMARRSGLSSRVKSRRGKRAISWTPSAAPQEPAAVAALTDSMPPIWRKAALSFSFSASMQNVRSAVVACKWVAHLVTWSRRDRTLASRVCRAASINRDFLDCNRLMRWATLSSTSSSKLTHSSCNGNRPRSHLNNQIVSKIMKKLRNECLHYRNLGNKVFRYFYLRRQSVDEIGGVKL